MPQIYKKYRFVRLEPADPYAGWGCLTLKLGLKRYQYDWGYSELFTRLDEELTGFQMQLEKGGTAEMRLISEPGSMIVSAEDANESGWLRVEVWSSWPGEESIRDMVFLCSPSALRRAVSHALRKVKNV